MKIIILSLRVSFQSNMDILPKGPLKRLFLMLAKSDMRNNRFLWFQIRNEWQLLDVLSKAFKSQ